ncbi:MAG: transporter substrate-binding domain-containing protein [Clostridia bacterium]
MKKILLTLTVLVVCLSCVLGFAGCNKKTDWDYINSNGELVVGYTVFAPISYVDVKTNELIGFDVELAKEVGKKLGVKVTFQEIEWDQKINEINSKTIDCIWNGMTITDEIKKNLEVSDAYLLNKQVAIVAKNSTIKTLEDLKTKAIGAEAGSAGALCIENNEVLKGITFTKVAKQMNLLTELKAGSLDAGVMDSIMAGYYLLDENYKDFKILENVDFAKEEYGIGFRKGDVVLTKKVNDAIAELKAEGKVLEIAKKYNLESSLK